MLAGRMTVELVRHVTTRRLEEYSAEARHLARNGILDFLAVTVAGGSDPLAGEISQIYRSDNNPSASFLGIGAGGEWVAAAAVNGFVSHVLDFDDMSVSIRGHPSAPVLSALLPLAGLRRAAGRDLLLAYMAAVDGMALVGRILATPIQEAGFHTTATLGSLGTALACGILMELEARQLECAVSLALAQGGGLVANFGTPAKPMQVGLASAAGARAAELARHGVQGSPRAIEAMCAMLGVEPDLPRNFVSDWEEGRISFKRYPSCSLTHQAIEAGKRLKRKLGRLQAEAITVHGSYRVPAMLHHPVPEDRYQVKFSLPYCLAVAMVFDGPLAGYLSPALPEKRVLDLARKMKFRIHPDLADASTIDDEFTLIEVRCRSGETLSDMVKEKIAIVDRSELLTKASWCLKSRGLSLGVERLADMVENVEALRDVNELVALVNPEGARAAGPPLTEVESASPAARSGSTVRR